MYAVTSRYNSRGVASGVLCESALMLFDSTDRVQFKENSRMDAESNISTVTLRGDEKGSLESETIKCGHESHWTRT
jgi:hypothetical protein